MKFKLFFPVLILISTSQALAFDRLFCQGQLKNWTVNLTPDNRTTVITPYRQSITLTSQQSETLVIKNTNDQIVATIFPWNTLYVRKAKNLIEKYNITSVENNLGFEVEITEKSTKSIHRLSCRFTF